MRIAFIHPFLFRLPRGIERFTFNLANTLASGDQVNLITWKWPQTVQMDRLDERIKVHMLPTSRYYAAQAMIPFYVANLLMNRYDWVWIFFAGYGEGVALSLVRRQRFGIVFHYPYSQVPHRYREFQRFGLVGRARRLVSVSRCVADGVYEFFGRESAVIHHGVDAARFKPCPTARVEVRSMLGLEPGTPLLVTAAALEERKGVQWVLRALPGVVHRFPDIVYLILGEGAHRPALESIVRELGIANSVRFLGAQPDVTRFYQAADLSIILARGEASSLTALESMACGLPVVASNRRPFDELLTPDDGVMTDETNTRKVSQQISQLLADPKRREKMGKSGRARVCADFTWERVGEQYVKLMRHSD